MIKATAIAHPIQGLIKYHGLKDPVLRIPFHSSISVCTGPIRSKTTVEPDPSLPEDRGRVDGVQLSGRPLERVVPILDKVRKLSNTDIFFKVASENDFPSNIGLGASASGFAALALAACESMGLGLDLKEVSKIARLGAGSASRSVTGGFSYWEAGSSDEDSFSYRLDQGLQMGIIGVVIPAFKNTEDAHTAVLSSPFFKARLEYIQEPLEKMKIAIAEKEISEIGKLAEIDTLNLHGITMTSIDEMILWQPDTVRVIQFIRQLRTENVEVFFSIDTGATVYVNTPLKNVDRICRGLQEEGFETITLEVGGEATTVLEHLF